MPSLTTKVKDGEESLSIQVTEIARKALKDMVGKGMLPWPDIYSTEFWQVAKEKGYDNIVLKRTGSAEIPAQLLDDFLEQTDQILDGVKDTVHSFMSGTKDHWDGIALNLELIEKEAQHDPELKEKIRRILEYNQALIAHTARTEKDLKEQADIIEDLQQKMRIDNLTGLLNRYALEKDLQKEMAKARRYQFPLSIIMIDINNFKDIIDSYGQKVGDRMLKKLSEILSHIIREADYIYRYNNEQFVIMMPHTLCQNGISLAERIRQRVARHVFTAKRQGYRLSVTLSMGVSEFDIEDTVTAFLIRVEKAVLKTGATGINLIISLCNSDLESDQTNTSSQQAPSSA